MAFTLDNLTTEGLAPETLPTGSTFHIFDTDIYDATIKVAYGDVSKTGSQFVALTLDIDGKEFTKNLYVTNREGKNYYYNNNVKVPLPSFQLMQNLCIITTNKPLSSQKLDIKQLKVFSSETGKQEILPKQVFIDLLDKKCKIAIRRQKVNKRVFNESTKTYVTSSETRDENELVFVLYPNGLTCIETENIKQECLHKHEDPATVLNSEDIKNNPSNYSAIWLEKNKGTVMDKTVAVPTISSTLRGFTSSATPAPVSTDNKDLDDLFNS